MRTPIELKYSHRLINHGPTTLVTAAAGGATNVMAVAWVMPLDFDPPRIVAVLSESYTRELIDASGELAINVPPRSMLEATYSVGTTSGRGRDKLALHGLGTSPAGVIGAPLVDGCVAWLECRVIPEPRMREGYDLYVADVVAAWVDDSVFQDGCYQFRGDETRTIHHMARGTFFVTGPHVDLK